MRTITTILTATVLALSLNACGKKGKGSRHAGAEGGPGADAVLDPTQATKAAKEAFARAAKRYMSAKSDGSLSGAECDTMAKAWMDVYKKHGKQMAVAYFNAGAVWEECKDLEKAEAIYQKMTRDVPAYDMSYNNLGVIYWNRKQESRALDYFSRAVKVNPRTNAPRNNLAAALRDKYSNDPKQGDFDKAEGEIQRVLAVDSNNRIAYENLARLYYDRGRMKDKSYLVLANLVVTQGIKVISDAGKKSSDLLNLKGLLLMQEDNQVEALKAFKRAVEITPRHPDANLNMALIAIRFRDYQTAEKSFKTAAKDRRHAKNIETYLGLGVAQRGLRKYKEAENSFNKAAKLKKDPRAVFNKAILYHEHLAIQEDLNLDGIKKHYNTAKGLFKDFVVAAGSKKEFAVRVADAKSRIEQIDESFKTWAEMKELEKKAKEIEAQARRAEEEEKKSLLGAEQRALQAAKKAEEAAKKAAAADAAKKDAAKKDAAKKDAKKGPAKKDPKKKDPKKK